MLDNPELEQAYHFITEEEEDICEAIPEDACQYVPGNFFLNAINGMLTKLADQLASPSLVLPWFLDALGASASVTGFLTPVRRSGALLPQMIISGQIRQFPKRKWFWIAGGAIFALMLLLMVPTALLFSGLTAGIIIIVLLGLGSLARGVSSVAYKDVLAKTIPRGRRGRLLALRATVGGALALGAGVALKTQISDQNSLTPYLWLVGISGALWLGGAAMIFWIREQEGFTEGGRNAIDEVQAGYRLLRQVPGLRKFVLARSVLLSIELSLPFYALYARRMTAGGAGDLGVFVIAASLAQVLSSPIWGRLVDRTSRWVMIASGGMAFIAGVMAIIFGMFPEPVDNVFVFAIPVMLVGFSISGVRLGRKTYLVDGAPNADRPLYVSLSNTVVGILTLVGGGLGFIADAYGVRMLIGILTVLALLGALLSWRLPQAENLSATQ